MTLLDERRGTADRIFRGALVFNGALTAYWIFIEATHHHSMFFQHSAIDRTTIGRIASGILFFVAWGFIWYGIKGWLLTSVAGFSTDERRQAYSSRMAVVFRPDQFAEVFALIWGSYLACDAMSEVGGALFGKQTIRVWGIGDVNRKSIGGTATGFVASLVLCLSIVLLNPLGTAGLALAVVISLSNTLLELFSPRGTDDFVMATASALICWGFGATVLR